MRVTRYGPTTTTAAAAAATAAVTGGRAIDPLWVAVARVGVGVGGWVGRRVGGLRGLPPRGVAVGVLAVRSSSIGCILLLLLLLLLLLEEKCLLVLLLLLEGEVLVAAAPPATAAVVHGGYVFVFLHSLLATLGKQSPGRVARYWQGVGLASKRRVDEVVLQRLGLPAHFLPLQSAATLALAARRLAQAALLPVFCVWVGVWVLGETPSVFMMMECHHRKQGRRSDATLPRPQPLLKPSTRSQTVRGRGGKAPGWQ